MSVIRNTRKASKPNLKRGLVVAATLSIATLGLSACSSAESGNSAAGANSSSAEAAGSALDKDTLVIGFDNTFVPMGFDDNGETKGFDVDLAKAFAESLGKKVQFQNIDWNLKEAELNSGKIDAIWNGYSSSPERAEKVGLSNPYMNNQQVIMVMAGSPVKTKADLNGKNVATQAGSTGEEALLADKDFTAGIQNGQPTAYPTYDQALRDLQVGRVDAIVGDAVLLKYYAKQQGADKFRVLDENFGDEEYVVGVRKNDTRLKEELNKFLEKAKSDGTLETITKKWFN
ncbi:hypothetical protein BSR28_07330 [Boudabousia liubingyangii]|uniref:amino acid ABC transporter substrate-binding protein n=1 Tax=Boudabousia liubingyangii TaxID=1921764 RepID=UPI00093E88C9|nr:amino acid ABC transporter substrate-binding protein [Boudabousia liubingyangii]OKL46339.1 hypothetical protein BSR28_07330 [Boudabousia liubingyangii]